MRERSRMKFMRAGSTLEIPDGLNRISRKEREEAYLSKHTGWIGRVYYWEGQPAFAV